MGSHMAYLEGSRIDSEWAFESFSYRLGDEADRANDPLPRDDASDCTVVPSRPRFS